MNKTAVPRNNSARKMLLAGASALALGTAVLPIQQAAADAGETIASNYSSSYTWTSDGITIKSDVILSGNPALTVASGRSVTTLVNWGTIKSAGYGLGNAGTIGSIVNYGLISSTSIGSAIYSTGSIGTITNNGTITATGTGIYNGTGGTINTITNNGLIAASGYTANAIDNRGSIAVLSNSGTIDGGWYAIYNEGAIETLNNAAGAVIIGGNAAIYNALRIGTLTNSGTISGLAVAIYNNAGTIGTLTNSGTITGSSYAIYDIGSIGTLTNSGVIAGNIYSSRTLTISGGSGAVFGTLMGYGGSIGTISATGISFTSGNLLLNDNITVGSGSGTVTNLGATLGLTSAISISGNYSQTAGVLSLGSTGALTVSGTADLSGGTVTASLASTGNYLVGDGKTLISAGTLTASGVMVSISSAAALSVSAIVDEGDLVVAYLNDYVGGTLASYTNTGAITAANYAFYVAASGSIGSLTNSGTLSGDLYAFYNAGTIGTFVNTGVIADGTGFYNSGSIGALSNSGTISGGNGIYNTGTIGTLTNAAGATIVGTSATGIYNAGRIGVLSNNGTIFGKIDGISNFGIIATLTNAAGVTIHATSVGIYNTGTIGTLSNSGTISGDGYTGIDNSGKISTLTNNAGGVISGENYGIENEGYGTIAVLTNAGVIEGSWAGIYNRSTIGTLTNNGSITGADVGLLNRSIGAINTITNNGLISGGSTGIDNRGGSIGVLANSGTIRGDLYALDNSGTIGTLSNTAGATIDSSGGSAVYNTGTIGTIVNAGVISDGVSSTAAGGISNSGSIGALSNSGTITGKHGIYNTGTIGAISNSGTIAGTAYALYNSGSLGTITNSGVIAGNIYSSGALTIAGGSGTVFGTLTGYSGAVGTISAAGVSFISGNLLLNDHINVGSGTVANLGATLELSGARTITGNYNQTGGDLLIDVSSASDYGELVVSSGATITGGTLTVTGSGLAAGESLTIVDASTTGSYSLDTVSIVGKYRYALSTVGADLILTLKQYTVFDTIGSALGGDAAVMGGVMATLADGTSMAATINTLSALSDAEQGVALKQLAPAQVGSGAALMQRAMLMSGQVSDAVGTRIHRTEPGWSVWGQVFGGAANRGTDGTTPSYDTSAAGMVMGADSAVGDTLLIGGAMSFGAGWNGGKGDLSANTNGVNSYQVTGYAAWRNGGLAITGQAGIGLDDYSQHRAITALNETAWADYSGRQYTLAFDAGYAIKLDGLVFTPAASFKWLRLDIDGYSETGAGTENLTIKSAVEDQVETTLGAKLALPFDTALGLVVPEIKLAWLHDFVNRATATNGTLVGIAFATVSDRVAPNGAKLGAGLTLYDADAFSLKAEYTGEFRGGYAAHAGQLQLAVRF
jgi:outer membrane autotransporter protein